MSNRAASFALIVVALLFASQKADAIELGEVIVHPYHVSLAEIERNETSGNFEVSLCVWPADLEKALARMTEKSVDLDTVENLDELIAKYLDSTVAFVAEDGSKANIRFVGHEIDLQKGWLYFEVQTGSERDDWTLQNRVFFELNDDQINHFNFKSNGMLSDACTAEKPKVELK